MNSSEPRIEAQYKTLFVIWASFLMSQVMFVVIVFITRPKLFQFDFSQPLLGDGSAKSGDTSALILGFAVAAVTAVGFSFAFRRRLNERAVAEQNPTHVQTGLIIALALCEASSLFGLALAFAFDYPYFFLWIALGIICIAMHFPKRTELRAAALNSPPSMQKPAR
ncbi:MAG: hypothetical protein HOP17_15595 [Acidobacteria bacterium]|nr:hypothetical protein [Acidobacteriota bacterium]